KPAGHPLRHLRLYGKGLAGLTIGDKLDPSHQAKAPNLADHGMAIGKSTKPGKKPLSLFGCPLKEIFALHDGRDLDAHEAAYRHAAIGKAMDEAPRSRAQRIDDLARNNHGPQRGISASDHLSSGDD